MFSNKMGRRLTKIASVIFIVGGVASLAYYFTAFLLIVRQLIMVGPEVDVATAVVVVVSNIVHVAAGVIMYKAGRKGFVAIDVNEDYPIIYFWGKIMLVTVALLCLLKGFYSTITEEVAIVYAYFYVAMLGLVVIYMYGGKLNSRLVKKEVEFKKMI